MLPRQPGAVILGLVPLVSGLNYWTWRMALILLASKRFATIWIRKRSNTMRHHNSVFHDLLKRVPWNVFDEHVSDHGSDKHVRHLTTKDQFIALLYG
jgi:hypothetical protein